MLHATHERQNPNPSKSLPLFLKLLMSQQGLCISNTPCIRFLMNTCGFGMHQTSNVLSCGIPVHVCTNLDYELKEKREDEAKRFIFVVCDTDDQ